MPSDQSPLVDLSDTTLSSLLEASESDTALERSLAQVLKSISNPDDVYSAFGSFVNE
jgi:hypothetical protein